VSPNSADRVSPNSADRVSPNSADRVSPNSADRVSPNSAQNQLRGEANPVADEANSADALQFFGSGLPLRPGAA